MPSACRSGAGSVRVGVLALQGAFREHIMTLEALGVARVAVRMPEQLDDLSGLDHPGRRVHRHRASSWSTYGFYEPIRAAARAGHGGVGHVRGSDPDGEGDRSTRCPDQRTARPHGHRGAAQRVRAAGRLVRGRPRLRAPRTSRSAACSSARRGSSRSARMSRCSHATTGTIVAARRGRPARHRRSIPNSRATRGCTATSSNTSIGAR